METTLSVGAKYKTSAVGLVAKGKPSYAEWEIALSVVCGIAKSCPWWIGDLLNLGEHTYGETYSQALAATGFDEGYLKNCKWVASHVEMSRRRDNLSFSHHQEVAPFDPEDQDKWLERAVKNHWSCKQLREAIQGERAEQEGEAGEAPEEDGELTNLIDEIEEYLDGLPDNHARGAALETMLRKIKTLAAKYRESQR